MRQQLFIYMTMSSTCFPVNVHRRNGIIIVWWLLLGRVALQGSCLPARSCPGSCSEALLARCPMLVTCTCIARTV